MLKPEKKKTDHELCGHGKPSLPFQHFGVLLISIPLIFLPSLVHYYYRLYIDAGFCDI